MMERVLGGGKKPVVSKLDANRFRKSFHENTDGSYILTWGAGPEIKSQIYS
jgi:hypothetical protein